MQTITNKKYQLINNLAGWITFIIASVVYLLTIEPTASFWDCGEFIASGFKLEVGHPPGAPFFMLLVRFFTMFAPSNEMVPVFANALSAFASSFTILFLFWSITHLAKKSWGETEFDLKKVILIVGSGLVGALAYTFSDTFWFSAVEGEVYATSSLFTALVFWAILKWENEANEPYSNRWIILIAYLMGLSIGVHLLNLLAIPAIVMVYYFKKYEPTPKGIIVALLLSGVLLLSVMYGIIHGAITIASKFELLFVNGFGLPYNSGLLFFCAAITALIVWGIIYTRKHQRVVLNTIVTAFGVILLGYSTYGVIVIRSSANPPMDQNSPDNMFSLLYYLNREQYGDRPLIHGQQFNAPLVDRTEGKPFYIPKDGKYEIASYRYNYKYDERFTMLFPRMYSSDPDHIRTYKSWTNFKGQPIRLTNQNGDVETRYVPTFGENIAFFIRYQLGHMYWRYFMWNFAGRQNDIQGHGDILRGNWISGIPFIDDARLGPQDNLPAHMKSNKARNRYYMLPFILGVLGLAIHYMRNRKDFWVVMLLFMLTGVAIVVYLNQTPYQPRERDYAYAGSFYAFAIWIGLGVIGLYELLRKLWDHQIMATGTVAISMLGVPVLMASENWDDHDRSDRYISIDFAYNMLNSCEPNAILFTYGDNDTFPLWYAQEVEGYRTDVRVSNLSYIRADWYIDQMKRKAYNSEPLPLRMEHSKYVTGVREAVMVIDRIKRPIELNQAVDFMLMDEDGAKIPSPFDPSEKINYLPSKSLYLPINKEEILAKGVVSERYKHLIVDTMQWTLSKNVLLKDGLSVFDLLGTNKWERPIYYGITVSSETYQNLDKFFMLEGMAYRIVPIESKSERGSYGMVNTDAMYDVIMNKFQIRSVSNPNVYIDENSGRIVSNYRNVYGRLANALIDEGKKDSAVAVLNRCFELIPPSTMKYNYFTLSLIDAYYRAGDIDHGVEKSREYMEQCNAELRFFTSLPDAMIGSVRNDVQLNLAVLQELYKMAATYERSTHLEELTNALMPYMANSPN